ncbi:C-terminal processing protease CtpA/Prc [Chryseobacterium defluvii]|uniref:C-terminal processing protease CtpA/Prc n=1 Tax=Chryseobacterium defluvii TaxID=160396 RepID=A0A840KI10_9FLAO|nr:S41 family peptidase [Chryseobacterium defluvii]MBB4807577.1 C-terminal processing protease CtpA/Prc [Chryseobacterium defluvii]
MKKGLTILMLLAFFLHFHAQKKIENLNFENFENNFPKNWETFGENHAKIFADTQEKQEGKSSAVIESPDKESFKAIAFTLPENYAGKKITLSGYIKTENVSDEGFSGLWMRIDPKIAFDNMNKRGIKGTNPWKKYEITLDMSPENTTQIVLGALLVGKGKMWVDNLKVTVDGKDIENATVFEKKLSKADLDKEFDNGSAISTINLDKNNLENLKALGLIWGYLKYYHPSVAEGNYNWDYELFRIFPKINMASSAKRDQVLAAWIKGLGEFQTTKPSDRRNEEVKIAPDLDWITTSGFSKELVDILARLKDAKRPNVSYYVGFGNAGNPEFKNENPYGKTAYPDDGVRLLSLYRYWNIIQYYFPYKNLIQEDWKNVLSEFIPKFINAKNETEYTLSALEIIARIHDTHANVWGNNKVLAQYFGKRYTPFELTFAENKAVINDFYNKNLAEEAGLEKGDVITEINGKPVEKIIKELLKYIPASNYPTQLRDVADKLLISNSETIDIKFSRNGKEENKTLKTYTLSEIREARQPKDFFKMLDKNTAYFYMGSVNAEKLPEVFDQIKNTDGLVIDFRSYPSDFVVFKLGKLLKEKSTNFVKFTRTKNETPGLFTFSTGPEVPGDGNAAYKGKIAILINETTQSSAEYHTMAFRTAPKSKVFGSTTAGADGNVSKILLPGNISTMISGIGVYYPDGKETQRIGIVPDVEIKPTVNGIKNNKDEVLEKALDWLHSKS